MRYLLALVLAVFQPLQGTTSSPVLRFNWPVGVMAHVETEYLQQHDDGGAIQTESHLRFSHRMRVLPHAEGRLIQYDEHTYGNSSGRMEQALIALVPLWVPSKIVDSEGRFVRVDDTERLQQNLVNIFEPALRGPAAQMLPTFKDFAERMISGESVKQLAADDWDSLIGKWVAMPFKEEVVEATGSLPIMPGSQVPTKISTGMVKRVPCMRAHVAQDCGVYELRTQVDREGLAAMLQSVLGGSNGIAPPTLEWRDMEIVERVTLESGTMLPHEFLRTRTLRQAGQVNGQTIELTSVERLQSVFTYVDEP